MLCNWKRLIKLPYLFGCLTESKFQKIKWSINASYLQKPESSLKAVHNVYSEYLDSKI